MWMINNSSLLEDFFTKGFIPHFKTPLTNPSDPIMVPVVPVLPSLVGGTFTSIQSTTHMLWNFRDAVGPIPLPQSTVITIPVMWNPSIPFVLGTTTHITPSISGTQQMPGSTPMVTQCIPSTSATYSAPYNTQCNTMGIVPIYQQHGHPPMYSSNPQIQISGWVPNMHMLVWNVTVSPPFWGMHGQSLIDMSVPSVNQIQMVSSVSVKNPQGVPNQFMGAPYS